jgi:hypothetical protein
MEAFEDAMHKAKMEMKEEATIEELMALQEAKLKELKALHAAIAKFAKAGAKTGAKVPKPKKAAAGAGAGASAGAGDGDEEKSSTGSGASNAWAWSKHCAEKYADNWTGYQEEWMLTHTSKRGALQSFGKHCSSTFTADHASWAAANGVSVPAVSVKPKKAATAGSEAPKKAAKKAAPAEVFAEAASVASAATGAGAGAGAAAALKAAKKVEKVAKKAAKPKIADVEAGDIMEVGGKSYFVTHDGRAYQCNEEAGTVGKWAGRYNLETGDLDKKASPEMLLPAE